MAGCVRRLAALLVTACWLCDAHGFEPDGWEKMQQRVVAGTVGPLELFHAARYPTASPGDSFKILLDVHRLLLMQPRSAELRAGVEFEVYERRTWTSLAVICQKALEFWDRHPDSRLRWDALALAYSSASRYAEKQRELPPEGGRFWTDAEYVAELMRQSTTDPLLNSREYGRVLRLVARALSSADIDPVVFAKIAATRIYQLWINEHPSVHYLVWAGGPRTLIKDKTAEAGRLVRAIEARFPAGTQSGQALRQDLWSADAIHNNAARYYLKMLSLSRPREEYLAELRRVAKGRFPKAAEEAGDELAKILPLEEPFRVAFTAVDGRRVDTERFRGKVVLIDFRTMAAPDDRKELANIRTILDKYRSHGFEVVGVSLDRREQEAAVKSVRGELGIEWPLYFDGLGARNAISAALKIEDTQTKSRMFLLNKEGQVVSRNARGPLLEREVRRYLSLAAAAPETLGDRQPSLDGNTTVFSFGSEWSYWDQEETPFLSWNDFRTPAQGWKRGDAPFGMVVHDDAVTVVNEGPYLENKTRMVYFRKTFDVPPGMEGTPFIATINYATGAAIYLNGSEIERLNLPAGWLTARTTAPQTKEEKYEIHGAKGLLRAGTNVIAVRVHNRKGSRFGIRFDMSLSLRPGSGR